jgi:CRP-like cAMP-binding protein
VNLLRSAVQDGLRALPESSRLASLQRCTLVYEQQQPAEAVYLIEEGLVKLTRSNQSGGRIILAICGPGQLIGEEALGSDGDIYYCEAMTITAGTVYRISRPSMLEALGTNHEIGRALVAYLLQRKLDLAEKVELLCLHDVEYRILHYLAQLASLLPAVANGSGFQIPITQLELADLIGATRETTSTTLNQLERRGLIRLSRRLLTVPSPDELRNAASARSTTQAAAAASQSTTASGS